MEFGLIIGIGSPINASGEGRNKYYDYSPREELSQIMDNIDKLKEEEIKGSYYRGRGDSVLKKFLATSPPHKDKSIEWGPQFFFTAIEAEGRICYNLKEYGLLVWLKATDPRVFWIVNPLLTLKSPRKKYENREKK